jgi:hypothetical protein
MYVHVSYVMCVGVHVNLCDNKIFYVFLITHILSLLNIFSFFKQEAEALHINNANTTSITVWIFYKPRE